MGYNEFKEKSGIKPNICIELANGYTDDFVDFCHRVKKRTCKEINILLLWLAMFVTPLRWFRN